MTTNAVVPGHGLEIDWTNETLGCSCGWQPGFLVPDSPAFEEHLIGVLRAGPDLWPDPATNAEARNDLRNELSRAYGQGGTSALFVGDEILRRLREARRPAVDLTRALPPTKGGTE